MQNNNVINAGDLSLALLEQAGLCAYERDARASGPFLWLTRPQHFSGGALPTADASGAHDGFRNHIHRDDRAKFALALEQALTGDGTYRLDYRMALASGAYVWVQDAGRIEYAASGLPIKARGILTFLEPYISRAEAAERAALYDGLTNRPNRQHFEEHIEAAFAKRISGSVLIVSIDNMTWLNEAIGPEAANELLLAATHRLDRLVPDDALIGRTGGDSFGIWVPHLVAEELENTAALILQSFRDQHFATGDSALHISISIGAVTVPDNAQTAIEALTRAEQALKSGRNIGRNSYRIYETSEDRRSNHLASLGDLDRVQKAIASNSFVLAYQPIVSALNGELALYEALLRLRLPDGTFTSVFSFIQALELHGLAQDIDRHVLGLAMATLREHPEIMLSINISGATASDAGFQKFLEEKLRGQPALARRMVLEITETAAIKDLQETSRFVSLAHELGCRVALDDFGEGFTALQHLRHLAVDFIKIDGSLIKGITENAGHQVMVKAILSMAQHMDVRTIAEFVETEREAAWLQRHGADYLQGYYFGKAEVHLPSDASKLAPGAAQDFLAASGMLTLSI